MDCNSFNISVYIAKMKSYYTIVLWTWGFKNISFPFFSCKLSYCLGLEQWLYVCLIWYFPVVVALISQFKLKEVFFKTLNIGEIWVFTSFSTGDEPKLNFYIWIRCLQTHWCLDIALSSVSKLSNKIDLRAHHCIFYCNLIKFQNTY